MLLIALGAWSGCAQQDSRLSNERIPVREEAVAQRPRPILELGDKFLGSGPLSPGIKLPTGAVWQPSLLVFGTLRSAFQVFDNGPLRRQEWVNQLDLFGELKLTGTERLLVGIRPFSDDESFSGFIFESQTDNGWQEALNADLRTLFFEGEVGELFPELDIKDQLMLDLGFSVGRQPIFFQEGMLIDDTLDAIGVTRNSLTPFGLSNLRLTGLFAWRNVHRDDNREDDSASLIGFFTQADTRASTINLDFAYVDASKDSGRGFFSAISAVQRLGPINTTFRALLSLPIDNENAQTSRGGLLFGEASWQPPGTHNVLYLNGYWGIERFSSAARGPLSGGPLGRTGILHAAVGLGGYGSPLSNVPDNAAGASLGYQMFFSSTRKQLIVELGGRKDTDSTSRSKIAIGGRYQQAFGRHVLLRFDTFVSWQEGLSTGWGTRIEFQVKF
ncbi:hypothetical protein JYT84_00345 [bacterium AH-315-M10]|nr:hypothetical protein [bacterium AH-315-M10]